MGNADRSEVLNLIGSVVDSDVVIIDDEIDTAGSITQAAAVCLENGASKVYATCTHAVLSGPALERLEASPIAEVVMTNTIAHPSPGAVAKDSGAIGGATVGRNDRAHSCWRECFGGFRSPDALPDSFQSRFPNFENVGSLSVAGLLDSDD